MSFLSQFSIQAGGPERTGRFDEYDSFSRAITRVFKYPTEHLIIFWKDCYIPMCYTYEMSVIIHDLFALLDSLMSNDSGSKEVHWGSDTFHSSWTLDWESDDLLLGAQWFSLQGHCLKRLNQTDDLRIGRQHFLCEWRRPLVVIQDALLGSGYSEQILPEMSFLKRIISLLPNDGVHYSPPATEE